ncbi:MAG: hypothetical protein ACRDAQ_03600 [Cetobacterium sp.]
MKKFLVIIYLLVMNISYSFKLDGINFNQRIDSPEGGYREMTLKNKSLVRTRYKINILDSDISKYIEVYPKIVTVEPQSEETIKLYIKAPSNLAKKEYDFALQFRSINIPTLAKNTKGAIAGVGNISISPVVWMKAYAGDIDFNEAIRFENIKVTKAEKDGIVVTGDIFNGATRFIMKSYDMLKVA